MKTLDGCFLTSTGELPDGPLTYFVLSSLDETFAFQTPKHCEVGQFSFGTFSCTVRKLGFGYVELFVTRTKLV